MARDGVRRRTREARLDDLCGVAPAGNGAGWALPSLDIEAYLVARAVPGEHRPGFRAWLKDRAAGSGRRTLAQWDNLRQAYLDGEV